MGLVSQYTVDIHGYIEIVVMMKYLNINSFISQLRNRCAAAIILYSICGNTRFLEGETESSNI